MAEYGLKVWNVNGFVQIDGTYKNLGLRAKGSVYSGGASSSLGWYFASVTLPASAPVLAWRATAWAYQRSYAQADGSITYLWDCFGSGVRVDYWLFDYPDLGNLPGNYGLRTWNAAGEVVFDSRSKYMRVLDALIVTNNQAVGDQIDNGYSRSYSAGTIAVVQSMLRFEARYIPIEVGVPRPKVQGTFFASAVRFDGPAALSYQMAVVNTSIYDTAVQTVPPPMSSWNYGLLVLDVSNY